ncbi:hypothetical protein UPYG_G00189230 [Umbra pygmaea]|uniref:PWWP domain-containing protein n=1 Tax=Umbra pygmaea TaxID=75934 RepID=A0ABD0X939_UMBPY
MFMYIDLPIGCTQWKAFVLVSSKVLFYLNSDELQDTLMGYMKAVLNRTPTNLSFTDELQFILGVLFPEAIIYGLSMLRNLSLPDAEKIFISGPVYHRSEVEEFDWGICKQLRADGRPFN